MSLSRKQFLAGALSLAGAASAASVQAQSRKAIQPLAIAMWDFSWLERRWPGAGYENWDRALDELAERGYGAVRIDAYPHLLAVDPDKTWTLVPAWTTNDWGAPGLVDVKVRGPLFEFMGKCRDRGIKVGLSSWYREDSEGVRKAITPESHVEGWRKTLALVKAAGLMDVVLYVDLCNEWPLDVWAPWFEPGRNSGDWRQLASMSYMRNAVAELRREFPDMPLTFSFCNENVETYAQNDLGFLDLFEHHLWMAQLDGNAFYQEVGYNYERFDLVGYRNLALKAEPAYRARPKYWAETLKARINLLAQSAKAAQKPLITTECWALVDYKDWPKLDWGWIKELCALGVTTAAGTGRWTAMASSNFCGPQFEGMWRDVAWHQAMTSKIRKAPIAEDLQNGRLWRRL